MTNRLNPDQARLFVGPDLDLICLSGLILIQTVSKDCRQREKGGNMNKKSRMVLVTANRLNKTFAIQAPFLEVGQMVCVGPLVLKGRSDVIKLYAPVSDLQSCRDVILC